MSRTLRSKPRLDYRKMDQSGLAAAGDKSDKVSPKDIKKGSVGTPKDAKDGKGVHKDSKASGVGAAKDPGVVHKDSKASGVGTAKDTGVVSKAGGAGAAKVTVAELLASSTLGAKAKLFPVDNESDADEEMIAIQAKMKQLDDEERRLNKSQKLREMKEELKLKQQKVKTLRVFPSATVIQQHGYKKFLKQKKVNIPPLDFKSGDLVQQEELPPGEVLYLYKDIKELDNAPEELKRLFTVEFANGKELKQHRHLQVQDRISNVVGSAQGPEKYIGFLTVKIRGLMPSCNRYRQNKRAKVVCKELIEKRTKLLKNLSKRDYDRFLWLLKELKIEYKPKNPKTLVKLSKKDTVRKGAADEVTQNKEEKLEKLRERFAEEKERFMEHKKSVLEGIERDIETYQLDKDKIIQNYKDYLESLKPKPKVKPYINTYEVPKKYRNDPKFTGK